MQMRVVDRFAVASCIGLRFRGTLRASEVQYKAALSVALAPQLLLALVFAYHYIGPTGLQYIIVTHIVTHMQSYMVMTQSSYCMWIVGSVERSSDTTSP